MGEVGEEDEATVVPEKLFKESIMNIEKASENVRTTDNAVKASNVPDK